MLRDATAAADSWEFATLKFPLQGTSIADGLGRGPMLAAGRQNVAKDGAAAPGRRPRRP